MKNTEYYNTIIVGGGAAGLYAAARLACGRGAEGAGQARRPGLGALGPAPSILLLEKTGRLGTKLLMSGAGQCNLTHGGNIKEFLSCYGKNGPRIRTCLYAHNNLAVCEFFESLGVKLTQREDGKIFPASMDAHEVRDALVRTAETGGVCIRTGCGITKIESITYGEISPAVSCPSARYRLSTMDGTCWECRNLLITSGGCSYPSTGSDGGMFEIIRRDLNLEIVPPVPALTPVFVENYPFTELSGISFPEAGITLRDRETSAPLFSASGSLLLTHRNFSGPVILNNSRSVKNGMGLEINFVFPYTIDNILARMKKEFSANPRHIEHWLAESYGLPKRFCEAAAREIGLSVQKVSGLSGQQMRKLAETISAWKFTVSGLAGFGQAMVTCGGVSLSELSLKTMEAKNHPGLYLAGEVLDIDGDTGGYNLQFAFASAAAAARALEKDTVGC
ncbi:MAG: aminoacetone oxidase family FAD-binding enzyme [Firmicutes bacterium]|nr:aminoacetone oxidase family FAD-binding enzyme [Bacillota bacterium]